jgi:hypothetical protein
MYITVHINVVETWRKQNILRKFFFRASKYIILIYISVNKSFKNELNY